MKNVILAQIFQSLGAYIPFIRIMVEKIKK